MTALFFVSLAMWIAGVMGMIAVFHITPERQDAFVLLASAVSVLAGTVYYFILDELRNRLRRAEENAR
jgi:hypothetical protein